MSRQTEMTDVAGDGRLDEQQEQSAQPAQPADPIAELQAKVDSLEDSLLRAKAESQNIQRRAATERSEAIRYANAELMRALIPVLEDFDRAFDAAGPTDKPILEGTRLVHANLMKALRDFGLETIEVSPGDEFDPTIHEAMMQQPSDTVIPGNVVEQVTRGYRLRDRVLRPARVVVAKAAEKVD